MRDPLRSIKWRFILSLVVAGILIGFVFLQWRIEEYVGQFLIVYLWEFLAVLFGISLIFSISCFWKFKKIRLAALTPFLVNLGTALILLFVPFTWLWLQIDFAWFRSDREKIVASVYDGTLKPHVSSDNSLIHLGPQFPTRSLGGNNIVVTEINGKRFILFFTSNGLLDMYSGFLHVQNGGDPSAFDDLNEADASQIVHIDKEWYYVSHHLRPVYSKFLF